MSTAALIPAVVATLGLLAVLAASPSHAHSWISYPPAYNPQFPAINCRGAECSNACPNIERPSLMRNTPEDPAVEWRRGQKVRVCWTKNNHHGGITRISLVPVGAMNSRPYHSKFTLFHTCWDAGRVRCRRERIDCGTDRSEAFCRDFRVPYVFPNGDYVVGYAWNGGLHFKKRKGWFPDYYSCSFVRVRGGTLRCNKRDAYMQYFESGGGPQVNRRDECLTSSDRLGVCNQKGCRDKRSFYTKPFPFNSRNRRDAPEPFTCDDVRDAARQHSAAVNMLMGNCQSKVCCHARCRKCGGPRCNRQSVGGDNCCVGPILRSRRSCEKYEPPCIRP